MKALVPVFVPIPIMLSILFSFFVLIRDCLDEPAVCVNWRLCLHEIASRHKCREKGGEAVQDEAAAVWLIEYKSDTVQQLHSPLGVIRPLTLLINAPHLSLSSKSLQSRLLTIKIYHMVSNNIISTRKLSEVLLCGLAKVEFIRTCTQVGKMIAADNFKNIEIEPRCLGETSTSYLALPGKETFLEASVYDRCFKNLFKTGIQ